MHECPGCGCKEKPIEVTRGFRLYFNCSECDYSSWSEADYIKTPVLMFAYGMNLNPSTMRYWDGILAFGAARLDNHRLAFRRYADVIPCDDSSVYGALWKIDRDALIGMDGREGYPHFYGRKSVTVTMLDDESNQQAIVYFMQEKAKRGWDEHPPNQSPKSYLDHIVLGFEAFEIPDKYLPFDKKVIESAFDF